jgi:glycosyltransferase involved in cell wall biosynthesis
MPQVGKKRVLVVHDWLIGMRGGEAVLEAILELFLKPPLLSQFEKPEIFTLIKDPSKLSDFLNQHRIHTSLLQRIPFSRRYYPFALPLFPTLIERFHTSGYDLVISSSHCVAKGIHVKPSTPHVAYIHAPMRYMWDRFEDYFGHNQNSLKFRLAQAFRPFLQRWDKQSAQNPQMLLCNSQFIQEQIARIYKRAAIPIYPFVRLEHFGLAPQPWDPSSFNIHAPDKFFLIVSALVPYKRIDIAVNAFLDPQFRATLGHHKLIIIGNGPERKGLLKLARSLDPHQEKVLFLGGLSNAQLVGFYQHAQALIFPGIEDFGITPLEAMACGLPIIALNQGGLTETVTRQTGEFFDEQSAHSLVQAIQRFFARKHEFHPDKSYARACEFSKQAFQEQFLAYLQPFL